MVFWTLSCNEYFPYHGLHECYPGTKNTNTSEMIFCKQRNSSEAHSDNPASPISKEISMRGQIQGSFNMLDER